MDLASVRGVLPHLPLDPADPVARRGGLNDEGRDTPLAALRPSAGEDQGDISVSPVVMNCLVPLST